MTSTIVVSLMSDDRVGIVDELSQIITHENGVWEESHLANLAGKFTGIIKIRVPNENQKNLTRALQALNHDNMILSVAQADETQNLETYDFAITANDRAGIVKEISSALTGAGFSIEKINSSTENASMSAISIFKAFVSVSSTGSASSIEEQLRTVLETLSDDIFVED